MGLDLVFFSSKTDKDISELYTKINIDDNFIEYEVNEDELEECGYLASLGWDIVHNIYDQNLRDDNEFFVEITDCIEEIFTIDYSTKDDEQIERLEDLRQHLSELVEEGYRVFADISY